MREGEGAVVTNGLGKSMLRGENGRRAVVTNDQRKLTLRIRSERGRGAAVTNDWSITIS